MYFLLCTAGNRMLCISSAFWSMDWILSVYKPPGRQFHCYTGVDVSVSLHKYYPYQYYQWNREDNYFLTHQYYKPRHTDFLCFILYPCIWNKRVFVGPSCKPTLHFPFMSFIFELLSSKDKANLLEKFSHSFYNVRINSCIITGFT